MPARPHMGTMTAKNKRIKRTVGNEYPCHQHIPGECGTGQDRKNPCRMTSWAKCGQNAMNKSENVKAAPTYAARRNLRARQVEKGRQRK